MFVIAGPALWPRSHPDRWTDGYLDWTHAAQQDDQCQGGTACSAGELSAVLFLSLNRFVFHRSKDVNWNEQIFSWFCVQVLIASHLPSYELRHNQVESIFLSAIDMYGHQFCIENLQVSEQLRGLHSVLWKRAQEMFSGVFVLLSDLLETDPLGNVHLWCPAKLLLPQQSSSTNGCTRGERTHFFSWCSGDFTGCILRNLWSVPPGLRPAGLHCVWAEQCSASTAEGQHLHCGVPVHAAHLAPKQVPCQHDYHAIVLCILAVVVPTPMAQWTQPKAFYPTIKLPRIENLAI